MLRASRNVHAWRSRWPLRHIAAARVSERGAREEAVLRGQLVEGVRAGNQQLCPSDLSFKMGNKGQRACAPRTIRRVWLGKVETGRRSARKAVLVASRGCGHRSVL